MSTVREEISTRSAGVDEAGKTVSEIPYHLGILQGKRKYNSRTFIREASMHP